MIYEDDYKHCLAKDVERSDCEILEGTLPALIGSRSSAVGIAAGYGLDDRGFGVQVPIGSRIFSTSSRPALGSTQPPIQ
jgi:hypothetical protein